MAKKIEILEPESDYRTTLGVSAQMTILTKEFLVELLTTNGMSYAALHILEKWDILGAIKTEFDKVKDFLEEALGEETAFYVKSIAIMSAKEEPNEKGVESSGFAYTMGFEFDINQKKYPFEIQVTTTTHKTLDKQNGKAENTTETKSTTVSLLPDFQLILSEIPAFNIRFEEPLIIDIKRLSYVAGEGTGRYYQKSFNPNYNFTNIESTELRNGLSYSVSLDGLLKAKYEATALPNPDNPDNSKLVARERLIALEEADKKFEFKDGTLWYNLKKELGPLYIDRIGFTYKEGRIHASFDASLKLSAFSMSVIGLNIGVAPNPKKMFSEWPAFSIEGLSFKLKTKTLTIGGLLLRMPPASPVVDLNKKALTTGQNEFVGQVIIKVADKFNLIGTGIYGEIGDSTSVFLYAYLEMAMGGPPFFYVEGLALGFGYNRACHVPLDKVAEFPLTKQALSGEFPEGIEAVKQTANDLVKYMPAQSGTILIMLGIKFSTFNIVKSFALLIIQVNEKLRIDILGLSQLSLGEIEDTAGKKSPVVFVELAIKASFIPSEGVVEVLGLITPDSYIFNKASKLSGGFAFVSWFDGPHSGDFVLTIGGYHPAYQKPAHYPTVPRVALNWQVTEALVIKAASYFALTPKECMAGGRMEMQYHSGGTKADFIIGADFYIGWKPFYYDISVYISLKLSYRINITFKVFGIQKTIDKTISLDAGANLHIWGPDFSGKGEVNFHLKFFGIKFGFSFNVAFGAIDEQKPSPLDWKEFQEGFLPAPPPKQLEAGTDSNAILSIDCQKGMIKDEKETIAENKENIEATTSVWYLNKKEISLSLQAPVPITVYKAKESEGIKYYEFIDPSLLIIPMDNARAKSDFWVKINKHDGVLDNGENFEIKKTIRKKLPSSLYGIGTNGDDDLVELVSGFELVYAAPPKSGGTNEIPDKNFAFSDFFNRKPFPIADSGQTDYSLENLMGVASCGEDFEAIKLSDQVISYKEMSKTFNF